MCKMQTIKFITGTASNKFYLYIHFCCLEFLLNCFPAHSCTFYIVQDSSNCIDLQDSILFQTICITCITAYRHILLTKNSHKEAKLPVMIWTLKQKMFYSSCSSSINVTSQLLFPGRWSTIVFSKLS